MLEVSEFMACIADLCPKVVVSRDNLDREGSRADSDLQGWLSSVKLGKLCLQSAARRCALQCVQHDGLGGGNSQASFFKDLDQGSSRSKTGS